MLNLKFLATLAIAGFINLHGYAQTDISTQTFAEDLKRLVALNSVHKGVHDFSGSEAISLANATASQIIEITAPYHRSEILNAKGVCFYLLSQVLLKAESQEQKQEIVEIICGNYLSTDEEVQVHELVLLQLTEKDFNSNAKKYLGALIDSLPKFSYGVCARLSAIAQVKKNIPALWKIANRNITTMQRADIDVLASLARMGEKEAGELLCNYYKSEWNKRDRPGVGIKYYVSFAKQLAFSLDRTVLDCLISDFRDIDMELKQRGSDYSWWPSHHLGIQIAGMLKNYPHPKEYRLDPHQLLAWLNGTNQYELKEK